jgi:hypothetical protein
MDGDWFCKLELSTRLVVSWEDGCGVMMAERTARVMRTQIAGADASGKNICGLGRMVAAELVVSWEWQRRRLL